MCSSESHIVNFDLTEKSANRTKILRVRPIFLEIPEQINLFPTFISHLNTADFLEILRSPAHLPSNWSCWNEGRRAGAREYPQRDTHHHSTLQGSVAQLGDNEYHLIASIVLISDNGTNIVVDTGLGTNSTGRADMLQSYRCSTIDEINLFETTSIKFRFRNSETLGNEVYLRNIYRLLEECFFVNFFRLFLFIAVF